MRRNQTEKKISPSSSVDFDDYSPKTRRSKSREVSSRFLSSTTKTTESGGISSPNEARPKITTRGAGGSFWPSSSSQSSSSKKLATLTDHLRNDRLKDLLDRTKDDDKSSSSSQFLSRQTSCSEFSRFEKEKQSLKENHHPVIGGSLRYTEKSRYPGKTSSSNKSSASSSSSLLPGRLSVDENSLSRNSFRRHSDAFFDTLTSEYACSEISSSSYLTSTATSRRSGIEVSSRYLHDQSTRSRYSTSSDSNSENSMNSTQKNVMKRVNSVMGYGSATTQWGLSRKSGSPPTSIENKLGKQIKSFSTLKPPSSPSKSKGVGNLLSFGLELFKSKKSSTWLSPLGKGIGENAHQLRLLHNRLLQWRYVNARSGSSIFNKMAQAERNLINAWTSISNMQSSILQKKIQFETEKLQFKINAIFQSQIRPLEAWEDIERQHLSAVSMTKDCLHSVTCRVPLIEGAKMDLRSASMAVRHSTDLTASIKITLSNFAPTAEKMSSLLSELAEVVSMEKLLLQECFELVEMVSALEIQERSMKCSIIQMKIELQHQQQLHHNKK